MHPLETLTHISIIFLATIFAIAGVMLAATLWQLNRLIKELRHEINLTGQRFQDMLRPLAQLGGVAAGMKAGAKFFELFSDWLDARKDDEAKKKDRSHSSE